MDNTLQSFSFLPSDPLFKDFEAVRTNVYAHMLFPEEINNKYLLNCQLIKRGEQPAARLCLYENPSIQWDGGKTLLFGNLEMINDEEAFNALMEAVSLFAIKHQYKIVMGPINGSTWDDYRLPITNFGSRFITDLPQPDYYNRLIKNQKFEVAQSYYTHRSSINIIPIDDFLSKRFQHLGISIRTMNMNMYERELKGLYAFCFKAFAQNVYFNSITENDFITKYLKIKSFIQPDYVLIAEDKNRKVQGFILALPDLPNKQLIMKTIARNEDIDLQGLMTVMSAMLYNKAFEHGFQYMVHAFMHHDNRSRRLSQKFSGTILKEYALYKKELPAK